MARDPDLRRSAGFGMGLTYAQFALIVLRDVPRDAQGTVTSA